MDVKSSIQNALELQLKASKVGFDWKDEKHVWLKIEEELRELKEAVESNDKNRIEEEFGDVLFSLINYARFQNIEPETALERINQKFKKRFQYIEANAPKSMEEMSLEEMDALWDEAKIKLRVKSEG